MKRTDHICAPLSQLDLNFLTVLVSLQIICSIRPHRLLLRQDSSHIALNFTATRWKHILLFIPRSKPSSSCRSLDESPSCLANSWYLRRNLSNFKIQTFFFRWTTEALRQVKWSDHAFPFHLRKIKPSADISRLMKSWVFTSTARKRNKSVVVEVFQEKAPWVTFDRPQRAINGFGFHVNRVDYVVETDGEKGAWREGEDGIWSVELTYR